MTNARLIRITRHVSLLGNGVVTGGALATLVVNAPINLDQIDWHAHSPPADWASVRDRRQIAHAIRTAFCAIAFGCIGVAVVDRPFGHAPVT